MMTDIEWRPVRDAPEYEINSVGGLRRAAPSRGTRMGRERKVRLLNGYLAYWFKVDGKVTGRYAHRMVADAFLGPIPPGMQVNHKNGVRSDCRVENLEIVTNGENRAHSYRVLGVKPNHLGYGTRNHNSKLTWEAVDEIRSSTASGADLARKFGATRQVIWAVRHGKTWRDENRPSTPEVTG